MKTRNVGSGAIAPVCSYLSPLVAKISFGAMLLAMVWFAPSQVSAATFNAFYGFGDSRSTVAGGSARSTDNVTAPLHLAPLAVLLKTR